LLPFQYRMEPERLYVGLAAPVPASMVLVSVQLNIRRMYPWNVAAAAPGIARPPVAEFQLAGNEGEPVPAVTLAGVQPIVTVGRFRVTVVTTLLPIRCVVTELAVDGPSDCTNPQLPAEAAPAYARSLIQVVPDCRTVP